MARIKVNRSGFQAWFTLAFAAWLAGAGAAPAQSPTHSEPSESEYHVLQDRPDRLFVQLPNGLLVIAQALPAAPVVSTQAWVKTGSVFEQEFIGAGLSHYLEHLLAGGSTASRTEAQSNATLGRIGARTNAATGLDTVNYYINAGSENWLQTVDLMCDWMQHNVLTPEEFERERGVIQREFEQGLGDPNRLFWRLTQQARYRLHPARHPTIGYIDVFNAITREQLQKFYERMYVPNNTVMVVAGDIDPREAVDAIAARWADAPSRPLPEIRLPVESPLTEPHALSDVANIQAPRLRLAWPGTRTGAEHDYALDLLAVVLGRGNTTPLVREVRDEARLVNSISAFNLSFPWGEGFFGITAEVSLTQADRADPQAMQAAVDKARDRILDVVRQAVDKPISQAELDRARRLFRAGYVYGGQTAQAVAQRLARDLILFGDPDAADAYLRDIEAITPADLHAAARAVLDNQRLITVTLMPHQGAEPPQAMAAPEGFSVAYPDGTTIETLNLDNDALVEKFRETQRKDDHVARPLEFSDVDAFTLPNGLRVVTQRSTVVPAVAMQLYTLGGVLAEPADQRGIAHAMATMVTRGTRSRTGDQIDELIENLGASFSAATGNNTFYLQASALTEDWPEIMELLADIVLHPSFPEDEWDKLRRRQLAAIARETDTWGGELGAAFREVYFGADHPWGGSRLGDAATVESLTVEDLAVFRERFIAAENSVLAIFGDIDPAEVRRRVTELFSPLRAQPAVDLRLTARADAPTGVHVRRTAKPLAAVQTAFGPGITRDHPDYAALAVWARLFNNFPSGWLETELRGRGPGLAYATWSYNLAGQLPGAMIMGFNTAPDSVADALQRAMSIVHRARTLPVSDDELQRARAAVLVSEFLGKQSNEDRATTAALDVLYGLGLDEPEQFRHAVRHLTPEDLRIIARTYFNEPTVVVISHAQGEAPAWSQAVEQGLAGE